MHTSVNNLSPSWQGLTVAFTFSMVEQLQKFPVPPSAKDPFWLLCFLWHSGLFAVMILGSIGWYTPLHLCTQPNTV